MNQTKGGAVQITIRATSVFTEIGGVRVRVWEGVTEGGVACHVFVRLLAVREDTDRAQFDAELESVPEPSSNTLVIPMRHIL
jgi:hypothetical protein